MGDRVNIAIQSEGKRVYFYGHWCGERAPELVRKALARKVRWDDPAYLARIIFDSLTSGDHGAETGFGISAEPSDNGRPFIVVCVDSQMVVAESDPREGYEYCKVEGTAKPVPFSDYIKRRKATWKHLDDGAEE